ncbi:MAG: S8 family peptidase [Bacteroidota bacterium]
MVACKLIIFLSVISTSVWAQSNRYVVFFKDKNNTPYSLSNPEAFLSTKSINRRDHSRIAVTEDDLPVNPSYVSQVKAAGAKTFFRSKWMNAVLVEASPAVIAVIVNLPIVSKIQFVAPGTKLIGGRTKELKIRNSADSPAATRTQLEMLGLDSMHSEGYYGEGITVSVFDSGFPGVNVAQAFQPIFTENRLKMTTDFVANSGNVYQYNQHGTEVFSIIAAQLTNAFEGGAFKASYILFVTEDVSSEYKIEEYNWLFAAEKADSAGTDVIQSSLGYNTFDDASMNYTVANLDGKTAVISKAAAFARDRGIIVVVSAGNEGNNQWHFITPPADVEGVIATGSVNSSLVKSNFSSVGPTADGRTKPDVVALGQGTATILANGSVGSDTGTSLAAPLVTSLVTGLLQAYPQLTPAEIIQAIKLSASKGNSPGPMIGYGIPNYIAIKNYLESNQSGDEVFIYPNPAASTLNLAFKKIPEGIVDLTFYDSQGKLLANPDFSSLDWQNNPVTISLSNLVAGTYLMKVKTASIIKTFRFVKL